MSSKSSQCYCEAVKLKQMKSLKPVKESDGFADFFVFDYVFLNGFLLVFSHGVSHLKIVDVYLFFFEFVVFDGVWHFFSTLPGFPLLGEFVSWA